MNGGPSRQRRPGDLADLPGGLAPERADFADELRLGRAKVSLSFDELGRRTLSSKASVSRWLNGRALPSRDQAVAWARTCGTDEATMIRLWEAADAASVSQGEAASAEPTIVPARRASRYRSIRLPAVAVLVAVVLAAAVTIVFKVSASGGTTAPSGGVTLTAGSNSTVGNCEVFSGTSDLPPGRTIVLGQQNLSDPTGTIYLQAINNWQDPQARPKWTGSEYFGSGGSSVGQIFRVLVISMDVDVVRAGVQHRVNDIWHVRHLPATSRVKQAITVTRVARSGTCGN